MGNIIINVCASQTWPLDIWGCLATLVSTPVWQAGLMVSSEYAVTRERTSCNSLDRSQCVIVTEVRSYPQYDGASFGYSEVGNWMCFHIACWGAIGWRWGTTYVFRGITYICSLTEDDFLSLEWEQSTNIKKISMPKYYLKTTQIHEKPYRFRHGDRMPNIDKVGNG